MDDREENRSKALEAAMEKRVEMKAAVSHVETAAAAPSRQSGWQDDLLEALEELRVALDQHVAEVEAPDGLLAELTEAAPRLANQIARVQGEHPALCLEMDKTIGFAKENSDAEQVRRRVLETLMAVVRHRQKGADLVYEGYTVELGGG